ncbi:uncharacterized protein isoform X2 [Rhodnius prolixus]
MAMTSTMISVQVNSKAVNILLHQTELRQILDRIDKIRNDILQDKDKRHYILNGEQSAKQYLSSYGIFIAVVLTFSMFSNAALDFSTNMEKPHLLLQIWIPWKMSTGWLYAAGQIFNCFCVLPTAFLYVVYVGLNFMFTYEMSAFLKVLQARMKEMKRLDDPDIYRQHREILRLLTDYNDLFSGLMYIEVLVSPLEPCGFGFALMKTIHTNLFVSLDLFCKFLVAVLASFILCACGQEISTQVDNLHESAYMSNWYNEEPAMRKYLLQLMTITVQPNGLCYRKMLMFNFVCFTSIAQAIYSYLSMLKEDKSPFKLAYKSLKYAGIMNQEGRPWSLVYTTVMVIGSSCLTVLSIADLIWGQEELPEFVSALSTLTITIHVNSKMINILRNQTEIRQLINRFENVRQKILQDNRRKHLILWADQFSLKVAFYYGMFFASCPIFSTISNIIIDVVTGSEKPHLVLQLWVPWRIRDLETYLGATLVSIVCIFPTASIYMAFTVFNFIFTIELSAFLQFLQSRFETLKVDNKEVYRQHKEIIELLRDYNEIFSGQLYVEIIISSLQPCGFGYTFIKAVKKLNIRAIDYIYKFMVSAASPFILCACGQEISTQLEKLHTSCYMCNWYEEKPASRRYLGQVMTVTLKPIALSFRRMVPFNYVCFASVAQGIYSYLMMVYQFDEGD